MVGKKIVIHKSIIKKKIDLKFCRYRILLEIKLLLMLFDNRRFKLKIVFNLYKRDALLLSFFFKFIDENNNHIIYI